MIEAWRKRRLDAGAKWQTKTADIGELAGQDAVNLAGQDAGLNGLYLLLRAVFPVFLAYNCILVDADTPVSGAANPGAHGRGVATHPDHRNRRHLWNED
jgi:hypothetical protein